MLCSIISKFGNTIQIRYTLKNQVFYLREAAMADEIDYKLIGDDMQAVIITLDPGESVQAEAGAMMYMDPGIEMNTEMQSGVMGGLKRIISGESFFITSFTNNGSDRNEVAFAAPYPGKILPLQLESLGAILCQRDAYLCSAYGIDISVAFTKRLGAGFFGGEGFILQRLEGDGLGFIHAGGTLIKKELQPGETVKVDTGCLVAFTQNVSYDIKFVGGIKTAVFGGEGLFFALLTGPGTVWLQTLPFSRLADRICSAKMSRGKGEVKRGSGLFGNIVGDIISGD